MSAPRLTLVQTPAHPVTGQAASFDASRPAPHTDALRNAYFAGHQQGFRKAYVQGWRWGLACGVCTTLCLAILLTGIAIGLGLL